jgi:small-conductance mechanosensitive channel
LAALEQERAGAVAREADGGVPVSSDESGLPDFDEDSIDFEEVGDQTRRLLRLVVGAVVAIAIWFGWADILRRSEVWTTSRSWGTSVWEP